MFKSEAPHYPFCSLSCSLEPFGCSSLVGIPCEQHRTSLVSGLKVFNHDYHVKELLARGADMEAIRVSDSMTALLEASWAGHSEIVQVDHYQACTNPIHTIFCHYC